MVTGREKAIWTRFSMSYAQMHNLNCKEKISADDVNPYAAPKKKEIIKLDEDDTMKVLSSIFGK